MLLDAKKGKPIEVEVILGEVVRMAKERGVPVPVSVTRSYTRSKLITSFFKRVEMLYALLVVVQNQILRKLEVAKK
jgi:2-dehydropantoate 2-reductase